MTPSFSGRMALMWFGRAAHHPLGLEPDGDRAAVVDVDGDDRRLVEDDALAADVDQGVGGAEVDGEVATEAERVVASHAGTPSRAAMAAAQLLVSRMLQIREEDADLALGRLASESLPCTRFSVNRMPRSPRIVPGAALRGLVAPIIVRTTSHVSSGPSTHHRHDRAAAHERHEVVVETLADVLLVVPGEGVGVERAQVHGDDRQALGLEAGEDLCRRARARRRRA